MSDAPAAAPSGPMRLALCVVCVVRAGGEWVQRLQMRKIAETTTVPFRVLAATPRASDRTLAILGRRPWLDRVPIPETDLRGSAEHAYYLDSLVAEADRQGFTHFATLDVDSFPVRTGWAEALDADLSPRRPFAAALRAENDEHHLPHPSGLFCRMDFWRAVRPAFLPTRADYFLRRPGFWLRHRQRRDTGVGYAIAAARAGCDWLPLLRSNARNDHTLMAGLYGDTFFHLGAMSRAPMFECDWWDTPEGRMLWRTRHTGLFGARRKRYRDAIVARNRETRARIVAALQDDADAYIASLR